MESPTKQYIPYATPILPSAEHRWREKNDRSVLLRTCRRLVSKMSVCLRMKGSESFRHMEMLGMYLSTMTVYRIQRSHMTMTTLLRTATSSHTSSSLTRAGMLFFARSSCCKHSLPITEESKSCLYSVLARQAPALSPQICRNEFYLIKVKASCQLSQGNQTQPGQSGSLVEC